MLTSKDFTADEWRALAHISQAGGFIQQIDLRMKMTASKRLTAALTSLRLSGVVERRKRDGAVYWVVVGDVHGIQKGFLPDTSKMRKCLKCREKFLSGHNGNRLCKPCKGSADFKSPAFDKGDYGTGLR